MPPGGIVDPRIGVMAYDPEELLRIARNAAIACVSGGEMPQALPAHPKLAAPGAAFVVPGAGGPAEKGEIGGAHGGSLAQRAAPAARAGSPIRNRKGRG